MAFEKDDAIMHSNKCIEVINQKKWTDVYINGEERATISIMPAASLWPLVIYEGGKTTWLWFYDNFVDQKNIWLLKKKISMV